MTEVDQPVNLLHDHLFMGILHPLAVDLVDSGPRHREDCGFDGFLTGAYNHHHLHHIVHLLGISDQVARHDCLLIPCGWETPLQKY